MWKPICMTISGYFELGKPIPNTRLTALERIRRKGTLHYRCRCKCGKETFAKPCEVVRGTKKSCGCLRTELTIARVKTHGLSRTDEYYAAHNAWDRCTRKTSKYYKNYGGRGITFDFVNTEDMARWLIKNMPKPKRGLFLDRRNNSLGYAPGNLKWSTPQESANNQSGNRIVKIGSESKTLAQWARASGVCAMTIHCRIKRNFPETLWLHRGKITKTVIFEHMDSTSARNGEE